MYGRTRVWVAALASGFVLSCTDDLVSSDDGPSQCVGGELCVGDLVCVDGFCVMPGGETSESGDGDGDGDGDGEPGDGDGEPGDGDGDGDGDAGDGDGDCELGTQGCACEPNEICDAGLSCVNDECVPATCGDGMQDPGEACDDGNDDNTDTCLETCELASCGDGYVGPGEGCDDGNGVDDDECNNECALTSCGDGVTQVSEECDDGDADNNDACLDTCVNASCGDGFVHSGFEDCDDANASDADNCLNSCVTASCGDGFLHEGVEQCDDANMLSTDGCVANCVLSECGDGFVEEGVEECDDANVSNTDTCLSNCVAASCGDGHIGPGESCDDGNMVDNDACSNLCAPASCGDGIVQMGEACDDGNGNNTDACLSTCAAASCGDGFVQQGAEECDDANADNTDSCTDGCDLPTCGDGYVYANVEECDDANMLDTDACLNSCTTPTCGDGFVQQGIEDCDDANMINTDACLSSCDAASCGDGFVQQNVEDCDDANGNNNDDCIDDCDAAACGDGFLYQGVETCDDGNGFNWDACVGSCVPASCGDGFTHGGVEDCDDANMNPGDGCDACNGVTNLMLSRGFDHTCLVLPNSTIRCWGDNTYGQLGIGSTVDIGDEPNEMPPATFDVAGIPVLLASGGDFNCVWNSADELRCWGANTYGQLGHENTNHTGDAPGEMPPPVTDVGGLVAQLAAGREHICALMTTGRVRCWGRNQFGQLGPPFGGVSSVGDQNTEMPPSNVNLGLGLTVQLGVGYYHNCVLMDNNEVRCWGYNNFGQCGYNNTQTIGDGPGEMPPANVNLGPGVKMKLGVGAYGACVLFDNGDLRCWGRNQDGELGIESNTHIGDGPGEMPPANVTNYGAGVLSEFHMANQFAQILMADGTIRNWGQGAWLGYNVNIDIGDGPNEMPPNPVILDIYVEDQELGVIALSKGSTSMHTCAVMLDTTVRCWGDNNAGKLGYGHTIDIGDTPQEMPPPAVLAY